MTVGEVWSGSAIDTGAGCVGRDCLVSWVLSGWRVHGVGPTSRPSHLLDMAYGSQITTIGGWGVVQPPAGGEPPPLRGVAWVLRRWFDPCRGRPAVRLHPLGDGEPGTGVPGREAGAVRPDA